MAGVSGKYRDDRGYAPEDGAPEPQSQGESMRTPGSGKISIPLGGHDPRSTKWLADEMQSFVGGGVPKEHEYESKATKNPKANRRRQSRKDV